MSREAGHALQSLLILAHALLELRRNHEAVLCQVNGGREEILPRQVSIALVRRPQAGHRAGHADRLVSRQARIADDVAIGVQVHVASRGGRSCLAVVQEGRFPVQVRQHEAATTDVAGLGIGDGEREGSRDRGVDGVAAGPEHLARDVGAEGIGHRDRSRARDAPGQRPR